MASPNGERMPAAPIEPSVKASAAVVVPTYNEVENLSRLVPELLALPEQVSVIVVDDASPDGTGALADQFAQEYDQRVWVIHRAAKLGLGTAYLAGFQAAAERGAECIITMDADFSHHPRHISAMLAQLPEADLVIGSRYVRGGGAVDSPAARRLLSWAANRVSHTALGLKAHDSTAGFRAYRRELLMALPLDRIFSSGYSFLIETLFLIERGGWRVAEVPIQFYDRTAGKSKVSRVEIVRAMYTVLRLTGRRLRAGGRAARPTARQPAGVGAEQPSRLAPRPPHNGIDSHPAA
jgi:glycosyltransferase involved in cell wall biosynthesis